MASHSSRGLTETLPFTWLQLRPTRAAWWSFVTRYEASVAGRVMPPPNQRLKLAVRRLLPAGGFGMRSLLAMALTTGSVVAPYGFCEDAAKAEGKKLQGTWVVVSCEGDGGKVPKEILEKEVVRFVIAPDTITIKVNGEIKAEDRYTLNPKTDPKAIDLSDKEGRKALGIYSLEGN